MSSDVGFKISFMTNAFDIRSFLTAYADALASFSPSKAASFYQVPFVMHSDSGVQVIEKEAQVETFFTSAMKSYKDRDINRTVPEILSEDQLSENMAVCKVSWSNIDSSGKETSQESNFYIISNTSGELKFAGLIHVSQ